MYLQVGTSGHPRSTGRRTSLVSVAEITELREVKVSQGDTTFVFLADHDRGRLVIREEPSDGEPEDVCALTIADREELSGFLTGLRRALGVDDGAGRRRDQRSEPPQGSRTASLGRGGDGPADTGDRDEMVAKARERNPQAFQRWTGDEEQRLLEAYRSGTPIPELARGHRRSERAIAMRLERLGESPGG